MGALKASLNTSETSEAVKPSKALKKATAKPKRKAS
jgi:hypothetical protein